MILEHALITIRPGTADDFEDALARARPIIAASHGFISLELHHGIEQPDQYLLLVEWESLDDHLVGFRASAAFTEWRALIGPFFELPPVVGHFAPVEDLV
ncbi:MAG TPA: antibiotic biosynthesis monooxygenase [Acidimicrobiales bacterium]|nr:antibiotic biosynthesis monooxygenase [Acidimicrobiales bacterium]HVB94086.1 antibiotic biosynthesis monooxygenase [Acidimicrobiales bacterium]